MIRLLVPNSDSIKYLWEKFESHRAMFTDELPTNPIDFACWVAGDTNTSFIVGPDADTPSGLFMFTNIEKGNSAFVHVFVWDRDAMPYKELVAHAREACSAVILAHNLQRLTGVTPVTHVPARAFAEAVGFKVEGRLRKAALFQGEVVDAWISGMTRDDAGLTELDDKIKSMVPKEE